MGEINQPESQKALRAFDDQQLISGKKDDRAVLFVTKDSEGKPHLAAKLKSDLGRFDKLKLFFGHNDFSIHRVNEIREKLLAANAKSFSLPSMGQSDTAYKDRVDSFITKNLECAIDFRKEVGDGSIPMFLPPVRETVEHKAYSRSVGDGKSFLVFLRGPIDTSYIHSESKDHAAVVNAANEQASPQGHGITGALGAISNKLEWISRTNHAKGGADRKLAVGECISIRSPFIEDKGIGVKYLFHSLGRRYSEKKGTLSRLFGGSTERAPLLLIQKDLTEVYENIFKKAEELDLKVVECPMISGGAFKPPGLSDTEWTDLNSSFFVKAANEWLTKGKERCAILIDRKEVPSGQLGKKVPAE